MNSQSGMNGRTSLLKKGIFYISGAAITLGSSFCLPRNGLGSLSHYGGKLELKFLVLKPLKNNIWARFELELNTYWTYLEFEFHIYKILLLSINKIAYIHQLFILFSCKWSGMLGNAYSGISYDVTIALFVTVPRKTVIQSTPKNFDFLLKYIWKLFVNSWDHLLIQRGQKQYSIWGYNN